MELTVQKPCCLPKTGRGVIHSVGNDTQKPPLVEQQGLSGQTVPKLGCFVTVFNPMTSPASFIPLQGWR